LFEKAYPIDYEVGMNDYESSLLADIQSGHTENSKMFDEDENLTPYGERVLKEMYDSLIDELGIEWLASRHPPSEILKRGDPIAYRVGMSEYEDGFESESDGFTYAYSKGHKDGMKDEVVYRPSIDTDREKNIYKKILRQKAESFDKDFSHVKTYDDYRKEFNRIKKEFGYDGEYMRLKIEELHHYCSRNVKGMMADTFEATTGYGYDDPPERMTDEEAWLEMYDDYLEDEDSPMTLEEFKKDWIKSREEDYQMQVKYEQRLKDEGRDMDGNPIKEADVEMVQCEDPSCDEMMGIDEGLSYGGFSYCEYCYDQVMMDERQNDVEDDYDAEGSNMKMALGVLGVGIGAVALLGGERIKKIFEKLGL